MPAGTSAEPSAGVRDGMEAFAFTTTETPANRKHARKQLLASGSIAQHPGRSDTWNRSAS